MWIFTKFDNFLPCPGLIIVIAIDKLIANRGLNIDVNFIIVCKVNGNIKVEVKSKIMKTSIKDEVYNINKILIGIFFSEIEDVVDNINSAITDKLNTTKVYKREVYI